MSKKVLVTGSDGFFGHWLCRYLESFPSEYEVVRVDSGINATSHHPDTIEVEVGELENEVSPWNDIDWENIDAVVHLAAQINVDHSCEDMVNTFEVNAMGTAMIVEVCIGNNIQLVLASSSEVYGSHDKAISEDFPLNGQSPYAASKIAADRLCYAAMETWPEWDCTIIRPFNTFGPGQRAGSYGGVIAKFIDWALKGEDMVVFGDGRQSRDYVYVMDTVRGLKMAIDGKLPPVVNLATGRTHRVLDIAHRVKELTHSESTIRTVEARRGEVRCLIGDASLARAHGWEPQISFTEGLYRCVKNAKKEEYM